MKPTRLLIIMLASFLWLGGNISKASDDSLKQGMISFFGSIIDVSCSVKLDDITYSGREGRGVPSEILSYLSHEMDVDYVGRKPVVLEISKCQIYHQSEHSDKESIPRISLRWENDSKVEGSYFSDIEDGYNNAADNVEFFYFPCSGNEDKNLTYYVRSPSYGTTGFISDGVKLTSKLDIIYQ